jgi:hypothetical protein
MQNITFDFFTNLKYFSIMEKLTTAKQIAKLHVLLNQSGLIDQKKQLILEASNNRTIHSKELTQQEITILMNYLDGVLGLDRMRKKIFALAYQAGLIYGDTPEDRRMNSAKLNRFIMSRGAVKKDLSKMNKQELLKTVNQFASIVEHSKEANHKKNIDELLKELNLEVK